MEERRVLAVVFIVMATSWYPALMQDLPPLNENNLDPNAAHVCTSTISESYTAMESFKEWVTMKTNTWCFAFPPRCTQYYSESKVSYRVATRYRQRKTYYCCTGYKSKQGISYCIPKCEYDCFESESKGVCIYPDKCFCRDGYTGQYCQSDCDTNHWGKDCNRTCSCGNYGSCDPTNGNCICHIGYTGQDCSHQCQDSFGLNCANPCVCENGARCNNVNGKCTCQPGFYGAYCHKKCDIKGVGEEGCAESCPCQNGGTCDDIPDACHCPAGYKGDYCTERCDVFHWGLGCASNCSCYHGICDPVTGYCECNLGYDGVRCETKCQYGYYGNNCATQCDCSNNGVCYYGSGGQVLCNCTQTGFHGDQCTVRDCGPHQYLVNGVCQSCSCPWDKTENCHPKTGVCQCKPGYIGSAGAPCANMCTMPFYGANCEETCQCAHGNCHYATGVCTMCYAGYMGDNCAEPCPEGTWGLQCISECECLNGAYCHATTGYCNCTAGFQGLLCNEPCEPNKYGQGCFQDCTCNLDSSMCNPYNGQCQCKAGYHGSQCEKKCEEGMYGFHCLFTCECNTTGTEQCDPQTGQCLCKRGWQGVTCNSRCEAEFWGRNCQQSCNCSRHGSCDQATGVCICSPGYKGSKCEYMCDSGFFGYNCSETCPTCSEGSMCDPVTGACKAIQCPPGYGGSDCTQPCQPGTYGAGCTERCAETCVQNGICHPINGYCICFPGFVGTHCEQECEQGKFGVQCGNRCPCTSINTLKCDPRNGRCGCRKGYKGQLCEQECTSTTWGPDCSLDCFDICDERNSVGCNSKAGLPCVCSPTSGYEGPTCSSKIGFTAVSGRQGTDDAATTTGGVTPIIIGAVVGALILIAIIIGLVIYFSRRIRRIKEENRSVVYQANGSVGGQTIIANGLSVGMDNPMYRDENLNNERRYPHLSNRNSLPSPSRQSCDTFDHTVAEKLRVETEMTRPTSGHYDEADEDRYTTLKSLQGNVGAAGNRDSSASDYNLDNGSYDNKLSEKYMLYKGRRAQNAADTRSRSPESSSTMSSSDSGGYINAAFATETNVENQTKTNNVAVAGVSQPLYGATVLDTRHDIITGSHDETDTTDRKKPSSDYDTPKNVNLKTNLIQNGRPNNNSESQTSGTSCSKADNPYDIPIPTLITVNNTTLPVNNGYLTPANDVNNGSSHFNGHEILIDLERDTTQA